MADNDAKQDITTGDLIEHHSKRTYIVLRNVYKGPFSQVYIVSTVDDNNQKYAMKCELETGNLRLVLKHDILVLMALKGTVGFPTFIAAGRTQLHRYCVMQLVGPDLGKLRRSLPDKRFSPSTAVRVLQQTLSRIEALHDAGWLSRDVKAPNFAIGLGNEQNVIYMLDFGFARKYIDEHGKLLPPRQTAAIIGTFQYASLSSHAHKDQSRKDDLESWLYMAIELFKGPLPWSKLNGHEEHHLMANWKQNIRKSERETFFAGLPKQLMQIMDLIDNTSFSERPDYDSIRHLLDILSEELNIELNCPMDWEDNVKMIKKAEFVGEIGESNLASERMEDLSLSDVTPIDIETD